MHIILPKPRLTFFRYKVSQHLPEFLLIHRQEHVKCLSQTFDLTVIDEDCDYEYICDKYQPDLTLFETGLNIWDCKRLKITNTAAHSAIPKVGFINADAWCETRSGSLSEMDKWGIETFFSISTTAAEHTPEIADNLFIWPPFIDADVYHDYREAKLIPVILSGSTDPQYPWRRSVYKLISEQYPSLSCPHRGYLTRSPVGQVMYGEHYARTLNASLLAPACGTVAKEVVRKHFEIPGCRACLITEASPALTAAGFVDMKNCVFTDASSISDKLDHLFKNPAELQAITQAGYSLVHSRHTLSHRSQILQWYTLHRALRDNQKIVQTNPFEPLIVADPSSTPGDSHIVSNGLHLVLLRQGDEALWAGNLERAKELYHRCLNYMRRLPEAKFRLALCSLYQGNAKLAVRWIWEPLQYSLGDYKAIDPDPVEWAYYVTSLLCLGKLKTARKRASEFPWLRHPELDRVRWAVGLLGTCSDTVAHTPSDPNDKYRASIHQLPERNTQKWLEELCKMLKACGQNHLVNILTPCITSEASVYGDNVCGSRSGPGILSERITNCKKGCWDQEINYYTRPTIAARSRDYRFLGSRLRRKLTNVLVAVLRRVEQQVGYFLPYSLSELRNEELCQAIERLTREENIKTVLILGAALRTRNTEALLSSVLGIEDGPALFCISQARDRFMTLKKFLLSYPKTKLYQPSSSRQEGVSAELETTISRIKQDNQLGRFDALLVEGSELEQIVSTSTILSREVRAARFVVLSGLNGDVNFTIYQELLVTPTHDLLDHNLESPGGYAIFKKQESVSRGLTLSYSTGAEWSGMS
jgi:hypothetical protein